MSLSIYAKCKVNHKLYRVELDYKDEPSGRYILRPVDGKPYQIVLATTEQLRNRANFDLFPIRRPDTQPMAALAHALVQ
jgi:hypothetical protein